MIHVKQQMLTTLGALEGWQAYSAIVGLLLICGLGVPLPEDITLAAAGIVSASGSISFAGAVAAGLFGVMAGDAFLYIVGRIYGRRAFGLPMIRAIMTPRRIALAERKLMRNSKFICFTARFLPGLRSPIFLMAGIMGVRPVVFYGLDGLAAMISVPLWVWIGSIVGENLDITIRLVEKVQLSLLAAIVALIGSYIAYKRIRKIRRAQRLMHFMSTSPTP